MYTPSRSSRLYRFRRGLGSKSSLGDRPHPGVRPDAVAAVSQTVADRQLRDDTVVVLARSDNPDQGTTQ